MNRRGNKQKYLDLIEKLKNEVEGIAIRSTFITGFPGETEQEFNNLIDFLQKAKLFNAGFFKYSREYGTPAYDFDGQVPQRVKYNRVRKLYALQRKLSAENLKKFVGTEISVVAEGFDQERFLYYGRAYFNAPTVDGNIYFSSESQVEYGNYYTIKVVKARDYDLIGARK
jgi:ribosomal protein S12 methylthiotransferase